MVYELLTKTPEPMNRQTNGKLRGGRMHMCTEHLTLSRSVVVRAAVALTLSTSGRPTSVNPHTRNPDSETTRSEWRHTNPLGTNQPRKPVTQAVRVDAATDRVQTNMRRATPPAPNWAQAAALHTKFSTPIGVCIGIRSKNILSFPFRLFCGGRGRGGRAGR